MINTNERLSTEEVRMFDDMHKIQNKIDAIEIVKSLSYRAEGHYYVTDLTNQICSELHSDVVFHELMELINRVDYVYGYGEPKKIANFTQFSKAIVFNIGKYNSLKLTLESLYNADIDRFQYRLISTVLTRENEQDRIVDLGELIEKINNKYEINQERNADKNRK